MDRGRFRAAARIDFAALKTEIINDDERLRSLARSGKPADLADAKKLVSGLVDILEFSFLSEPFSWITGVICEEARDKVLAESIANTIASDDFEAMLHGIWLSDIDTSRGKAELGRAIRSFPKATFLRVCLAIHLLVRVHWKHCRKADRLTLLDAADQSFRVMGGTFQKSELKRLIEREKSADPDVA